MAEGERISGSRSETSPRRGCFFWGCATAFLIFGVVGGAVALGFYKLISGLKEFSSPEAMELPVEKTTQAAYERAHERIEKITRSDQAPPEGEVVITPDDLNALIARDPAARNGKLPGRVRVRGEGEHLLVDLSWPLDELEFPEFTGLPGRYLNGTLRLGVRAEEGRIQINLVDGTFPDGKKLSEGVVALVNQAVAKLLNRHAKGLAEQQIESLKVKDGSIYVKR